MADWHYGSTTGDVPEDWNKDHSGTVYDQNKWQPQPYTPNMPYQPGKVQPPSIQPKPYDDMEELTKLLKESNDMHKKMNARDKRKQKRNEIGGKLYYRMRRIVSDIMNAPENGAKVHKYMEIFYGKHDILPLGKEPAMTEEEMKRHLEEQHNKLFNGQIGQFTGVQFADSMKITSVDVDAANKARGQATTVDIKVNKDGCIDTLTYDGGTLEAPKPF